MRTLFLFLAILGAMAETAAAQGIAQGDQARRTLLEDKVRNFAAATQPTVGRNIGAMLEVDRQINRVYQILNKKYLAQGKPTVDRKEQLRYFSERGSVMPSAAMADEAARAAEDAFLAQQEAALMSYVTVMQQARWVRDAAAAQRKASVKVLSRGPEGDAAQPEATR